MEKCYFVTLYYEFLSLSPQSKVVLLCILAYIPQTKTCAYLSLTKQQHKSQAETRKATVSSC